MKYKVTEAYKDLKNKHFPYGTQITLQRGGSIELDKLGYDRLPKFIKETIEPLEKTTTKVSKKDTKNRGDK
jgi:hypothetical protein